MPQSDSPACSDPHGNEPFVCGYLVGGTLYSERDPDKIPPGAKIVTHDPKWSRFRA